MSVMIQVSSIPIPRRECPFAYRLVLLNGFFFEETLVNFFDNVQSLFDISMISVELANIVNSYSAQQAN